MPVAYPFGIEFLATYSTSPDYLRHLASLSQLLQVFPKPNKLFHQSINSKDQKEADPHHIEKHEPPSEILEHLKRYLWNLEYHDLHDFFSLAIVSQ